MERRRRERGQAKRNREPYHLTDLLLWVQTLQLRTYICCLIVQSTIATKLAETVLIIYQHHKNAEGK
ncbi:CLUMA_CG017719, isoform A [Clunio marinus]|uniref:CLUMA_CG017719, isoform A n=1 Tax=Clunio marinus TaxID=568069 RepID=A0A1J1IWX3_9DIPT|nr:CLUMA_CG017719, isoform A [Clunio marinus]